MSGQNDKISVAKNSVAETEFEWWPKNDFQCGQHALGEVKTTVADMVRPKTLKPSAAL